MTLKGLHIPAGATALLVDCVPLKRCAANITMATSTPINAIEPVAIPTTAAATEGCLLNSVNKTNTFIGFILLVVLYII